jgi:hypothetical protein
VQIDDAYLGGERSGGKPGRGSETKQPVLIAVATNAALERPTFAMVEPVWSFDIASVADWVSRRLAPEAEAFTDGLACFRRIADASHSRTTLETDGGRAATEVRGARRDNVVLGNVKRAVSGSCHAVRQAKYARRYLAKAASRFNRRFRLAELLRRLTVAMMRCKPHAGPKFGRPRTSSAEDQG